MLVRLFDPVMQFQNKGGALNTAGRLEVYLEGTDDLAQIYSDEEGHVPLSQPAILDNNGRSSGLYVESGVKYRLTVRTNHGALLFTVRNMVPVGGGGGGGQSLSASLPLKIEGGTISNNGTNLTCTGANAWAEGRETTASGSKSHAEGHKSVASGDNSHAEGYDTKATAHHSHAEGFQTEAKASYSHAEGSGTETSGYSAHAEGEDTLASGDASHAEGYNTTASQANSHAEGNSTTASGTNSHAQGLGTRATGANSTAIGKYNDDGTALFVIGDGSADNARSDCFKVDSNGETWVKISGVLTKITSLGGGSGIPIYPTLQDAITDQANLPVGTIFETNGFHTRGDGGAARYYVSSSGTANGKNIIQLAAGKNAYLQYGDWIVPEQLGYQQSYSRDDVVPYITHAISLGCQHIHLRSSGNGAGYTWKTKLTVSTRGFKLTGEGDWGYPNKFTYIVFRPTDASVNAMIDMKARDVLLKDLDIEVTGDYVKLVDGITNTGYDSDENRFWEIDNVRFNSFDNCIKFSGGIKWQNAIRNCLFNSCKIGLQIYESSTFELMVDNCLFTNCEQYDVLVNGGLFAAIFKSCGFGSQSTAIGLTTPSDQYMYQNIKFEGCNFEIDTGALVNAPAVFIDCFPDPSHPYIRQNVTIANCHFTPIKVSYPDQGTTNRYIRLAPKTNILLISNQILGKDEPQHPDWVLYPKLIWNENYLPTLGFGGIVECGNNLCGNGNFEYPDALLPFVTRNTQARSVLAIGAQSGSESAISDCDTFLPQHCGEMIVGRASTYESTTHMPTTSIFGFIYSIGVTEGANKRVIQMMLASNSNVYTRIGRDTGGGWQFDPWKTITAS